MDCSRYRMKTVTTVGWDLRSLVWRISCSGAHPLRESSGGTFPNWRYRKKFRWRRAIVHQFHLPHPQMISWVCHQCQALLQVPAAAHQVLPGYHPCPEAQLDRRDSMTVPVVVELLLIGTDLTNTCNIMPSHTNALKLVVLAPFRSKRICPGITNRSTALMLTASIVLTKTARVPEKVSPGMTILHDIYLISTPTCDSVIHCKMKEGRSEMQTHALGWPFYTFTALIGVCLGTLKPHVSDTLSVGN